MAEPRRYVVTLNNERPLAEVERDLKGAGFEVEQSLQEIGVVVGTATDADRLSRIGGVGDVAEETAIDVGPPGGSDTW